MGVSYTYVFTDDVAAHLRQVVVPDPVEQAYEESPTLSMMEKRTIPLEGNYFHVDVSHVGTALGGPYVDNSVLPTAHVESVEVAQYTPAFYGEPARISRRVVGSACCWTPRSLSTSSVRQPDGSRVVRANSSRTTRTLRLP